MALFFCPLPAGALFHENTQKSGLSSYPEEQDVLASGILTTSAKQQSFENGDPTEL